MAQTPFYLQIVDAEGIIVRTRAGGKHEADLIDILVKAVMAKGVGFFKTEAKVEVALRDGIKEAIHGIKITNPYDLE